MKHPPRNYIPDLQAMIQDLKDRADKVNELADAVGLDPVVDVSAVSELPLAAYKTGSKPYLPITEGIMVRLKPAIDESGGPVLRVVSIKHEVATLEDVTGQHEFRPVSHLIATSDFGRASRKHRSLKKSAGVAAIVNVDPAVDAQDAA